MILPRVKIQFLNGQLGTVGESADGLMALICGATAVASKMELNTVYSITSMDDLMALGVTSENNAALYKHVSEFYDEAGAGTKLIIYPVKPLATMTALCEYAKTEGGYARDLITKQNGNLRCIGLANLNVGGNLDSSEGLDPDVFKALPKAQQLAEWATTDLFAPMFFVLEGRNYDGAKALKDLTKENYDRVGIAIGDTVASSKGASIGTLLGRMASIPVQRNIGRVKDGALAPLQMYVGGSKIDESESAIRGIFEKGYIVPRKYVGRTGYFYADDNLACDPTGDYSHIAPRRVIDKAYRIAYDLLLNMLLDELEVNEDGTLQVGIVKSWQQTVENGINKQMTANGELCASADGEGCKCFIDETQNVVSTSRVIVTLKVRPYGYARYVDVNLGFLVETNNS